MAEKYKCIKAFKVEEYDTCGFGTGVFTVVAAGSLWEKDDVGIVQTVLSNEDGDRLYIETDRIEKYFELVADQPKLSGHFKKRFLEVT